MPSVSLKDQISCIEREIRMRERVYPRWVLQGKLTQTNAKQELERMCAVRDTLTRMSLVEQSSPKAQLYPFHAEARALERERIFKLLIPIVHNDVMLRLQAKLAAPESDTHDNRETPQCPIHASPD